MHIRTEEEIGEVPPRTDFVILVEDEEVDWEKAIFRIFRKINVLEYKNPHDAFVCHYDAWRKSLRDKGFFSMLSSQDFGAKKTSDLYNLRMASETQYRILKSQEGFDTTRVHTDAAMMSKYAICFAASILRHSIMKACPTR